MKSNTARMRIPLSLLAIGVAALVGGQALAYDGTKCKEAGNCWEPKPGYPAKVAGSKYDPKHDAKEISKQSDSIKQMEARNAKRVEQLNSSGSFKYDVN